MPGQMDSSSLNPPWVVLTLTGELDIARTPDLDKMAAAVLGSDKADAVVDLSGVTFMDSSALRWLLNLQDRLERGSGRLRLAAPPGGSLDRLLSLSGLDGRFEMFATVAEATSFDDPTVRAFSLVATDQGDPADSARKAV